METVDRVRLSQRSHSLLALITTAMEGIFVPEDVHNIGPHRAWPRLRARYGDRFRRTWRYYLLSSAGGFRARFMQLSQIVMTRTGTRQPECRLS